MLHISGNLFILWSDDKQHVFKGKLKQCLLFDKNKGFGEVHSGISKPLILN